MDSSSSICKNALKGCRTCAMLRLIRTRYFGADFSLHADRHRCSGNSLPANDLQSKQPAASTAEPPLDNCPIQHPVKCWIDAAFSARRCTYAAVFLDSNDAFLEAVSGPSSPFTALHAKALALHITLQILAKRCYTSAVIMTDSLSMVNYLSMDESTWPWCLHTTLADCINLWHRSTISIVHIPRSANRWAHHLCQQCNPLAVEYYNRHQPPPALLQLQDFHNALPLQPGV